MCSPKCFNETHVWNHWLTNYGVQTITYNFVGTERTGSGVHDTHFWRVLTETLGTVGVVSFASVWSHLVEFM